MATEAAAVATAWKERGAGANLGGGRSDGGDGSSDNVILELRQQLSRNAEDMKKSLELSAMETNFQIAAANRRHQQEMLLMKKDGVR